MIVLMMARTKFSGLFPLGKFNSIPLARFEPVLITLYDTYACLEHYDTHAY